MPLQNHFRKVNLDRPAACGVSTACNFHNRGFTFSARSLRAGCPANPVLIEPLSSASATRESPAPACNRSPLPAIRLVSVPEQPVESGGDKCRALPFRHQRARSEVRVDGLPLEAYRPRNRPHTVDSTPPYRILARHRDTSPADRFARTLLDLQN